MSDLLKNASKSQQDFQAGLPFLVAVQIWANKRGLKAAMRDPSSGRLWLNPVICDRFEKALIRGEANIEALLDEFEQCYLTTDEFCERHADSLPSQFQDPVVRQNLPREVERWGYQSEIAPILFPSAADLADFTSCEGGDR